MKEKSKLIRIKPETIKFRDDVIRLLIRKKMSAYEIAKSLSAGQELGTKEFRRLYFKVVHNCRKMEAEGILRSKEEISHGLLPKRVYRRKK